MKGKPLFLIIIFLLAAACGPTPAQQAAQTATAQTAIAQAWTPTPRPTATALPPTFTPTPTTPAPTVTPQPTATPLPTPFGALTTNLVAYQEKGEIHVVNIRGENKITITTNLKGIKRLMGWSADGVWVMVARYDKEPPAAIDDPIKYLRELMAVNPSTGEYQQVMNIGPNDSPAWAQDGKSFVITSPKENLVRGIYKVDMKTMKATDTGYTGSSPAISADGKIIAWYNANEIRMMKEGTRPVILARIDTGFTRSLLFAPDGKYLLYIVDNVEQKLSTLYRIKLEGTDAPEQVKAFDRQVWPLSLSPNNAWILLADYTNPNSGWGVISPDGKTLNWVRDYLYPEWTPDGSQLIAQKGKTISLIDPASGGVKETDLLKWIQDLTGVWYIQPTLKK
ncbi:MAG TPA: hypothetical protein VIO61_17085 [Anaerolineaceae bacterium]